MRGQKTLGIGFLDFSKDKFSHGNKIHGSVLVRLMLVISEVVLSFITTCYLPLLDPPQKLAGTNGTCCQHTHINADAAYRFGRTASLHEP